MLFFVRCGRHCAKARSFTICTHKLQSGVKLRLALALHPAKKKLVKKDWCHTGKPSDTKQHHQKRAARHTSPSQKCVSPSQDTETTAKGAGAQHNTKHPSGQLTIIYQNWVTLTAAIEAGDTRKILLTKSTLSASMVRVRSVPLQLEMIKEAKGSTPPGGHTGASFRFPAARPGLCQTASVQACRLTL